jgi:YD repeat-containing protein
MVRRITRASLLVAMGVVVSTVVKADARMSYDRAGRVTSALYDNGLCITFSYDSNGNRTTQLNSSSTTPQTPVWGTGTFGCFVWTP